MFRVIDLTTRKESDLDALGREERVTDQNGWTAREARPVLLTAAGGGAT